MFDDFSDAAVVAAIEETTRAEAIAAARRSALVAELASRRRVDAEDEERQRWVVDPWAATTAEIGAAMGISTRAASREMCIALALRDRLPKVAALYAQGMVGARVVATITWRTRLVAEGAPITQIDTAIAEAMLGWGVLSGERLEQAVDVWVERFDPAAVIRGRAAAQERDLRIGSRDDGAMTVSVWGRLSAIDAELLQQRVDQLVAGVCAHDPRTIKQRRSDAAGVIAVYGDRMACLCGDPECPAAGPDARAEAIAIHILADQDAAATPCDGTFHGDQTHPNPGPVAESEPEGESTETASTAAESEPTTSDESPAEAGAHTSDAEPETEPVESADDEPPTPPVVACGGTAVIVGGGVVPPQLLAELIRAGVKITPLRRPADDPEPRYRPSNRLAAFVRMRDLTCRFPGCNRPADCADIDHTTPYPAGATHPANTKLCCRPHHLLKTFWIGENGWRDEQYADGTVVWTSPTGRRYRTKPGSHLLFPDWNTTTAGLPPPGADTPPTASRDDKMPKRRRTRAAERRAHIAAERARNQAYLDQYRPPPPTANPAENATDGSKSDCLADLLGNTRAHAEHDEPPPF